MHQHVILRKKENPANSVNPTYNIGTKNTMM